MLVQCHSPTKNNFLLATTAVMSKSQIVSTMSYLRFILIGTSIDKYQQIEPITD